MSGYVITRGGQFYAGFADGRPVWEYQRRPHTQFDGDTAEKILQQLRGLGYVGVELRMYRSRVRRRFARNDDDA